MASKTDQLLIVVSILGGRNFPKSLRHSLVVQAKFDGEQLSTDPVEHREQPQFCTELAWELDRRTLHQHRLQRTPIKLQCFAVDSISQMKESIGYIVLDLRSVQEVKQDPKWYPLLSSKYTKLKPAILLTMLLENDTKPVQPSPDRFKAKKAPPRQGSPALTELPEKMEAVLIQDQGYHQVGPPEYCTDMFVLSVTVAFATKLEQLIPSTMKLSGDSDFFFYYRLLENDITSEPFRNLLNPSFEPERASVRIRSSKQIIHTFLGQQPRLQIHLCCGNHSLGSTEVSLSALTTSTVDLDSQPTTVEGAFVLKPPNRTRQKLPALPADLQPTVGVAVTLRREEFVANEEGAGGPQFPSRPSSHPHSVPPPNPTISLPPPEERPRTPSLVKRASSGQPMDSPCSPAPAASPPATHPPASHTESEVESLREELHAGQSQPGQAASEVEVGVQDQGQAEIVAAEPEGGVSSVSVSAPKVSIPASAHHYCFSLDLRSLGRLSLTHPVNAMLRYSYQFFGSAAPIMTNPPVELQRNMEVFLPQSYCAFDFAALPQQLQDTFLRVPVLVEVWHRDSSSRDQLMGTASIQLSALLSADKTRFLGATGEQHWRQTHTDRIPVLKPHGPSEKVAELFYVTTLEDLGLVTAKDISVSDSLQNIHPPPQRKQPQQPASKPAAAPSSAPQDPTPARETMEYRTALELELWKEEQEDLFDDQLKKKELSHMQALAEEWRKRDSEREALVRKKEVEYNLLEEQLQKTLCDLERREKQLENAEIETQRLQKDLRAEHELTQRELQETSRRLRLDSDHRVALERDKVRLMEEERARLLQQIADGESRYKQLEKDSLMLREQQNIRPELRLQSEINLLKLEKAELERKLEATTKSKLYYKQQWGRALKELARFKQREQENAMARLKKQQEEIEAMRLRYLATEEKDTVRTERQELDDIRNELNRLKQQEVRFGPSSSSGPAPGRSQSPAINESADDHLGRLLEERDTLLRTGVYTHEDRIITELNRQIQQAMAERGTH